ncbi:MAG: hypothetical protein QXG63_04640 [Nitrososphaerales archaeon]
MFRRKEKEQESAEKTAPREEVSTPIPPKSTAVSAEPKAVKNVVVKPEVVGKGVLVGMCSQCIWGRVRMTVYDTGRDLLNIGVLPLDTLFPEVALVKMMWVLGNTKTLEEARELMLKDLVGEMVQRLTIEERRGFEQLL